MNSGTPAVEETLVHEKREGANTDPIEPDSSGPGEEDPWMRKTLLSLGTLSIPSQDRTYLS